MTYTLKVIEIRQETEDTVTLCFKQPLLRKIKYKAGQYLTLIFRINGKRYIRPYSFSSCPNTDEYLEITVKRVLNGIVSNHINDKITVGDSIEVMPPMGDFIFKQGKELRSVYLWGVGSGITPLISIAKEVLSTEPDIHVNLIYGNRTHESTIFMNQILNLQKIYGNKLFVKHFHTKLVIDQSIPNVIQGRIDQEKAVSILESNKELTASVHYICGPVGLKESVKKALLIHNINLDQVFSEDFELTKNPIDFHDIYTQTVNLNFEGVEFKLEVIKGKTILEAALDANIEVPYSCQTGNCDTCKARLTIGETKMIGLSKNRDDLGKNEILLCCSHPLTGDVQVFL